MIQAKILSYQDDISEAFIIRKMVFVEEQGIPESLEFDEIDKEAMHVIVYEENPESSDKLENGKEKKAVATGRVYFDGIDCKIGRIAVLKEFRGKLYGDFAVRMLLNKAFTSGINEVTIHAQLTAEQFYSKIGFEKVGENFIEDGLLHCKMKITQQNIVTLCRKK